MKKLLRRGLIGLLAVLILIQFVPYGRAHENPPVRKEPDWDGPRTRALAVRACFGCHSNEVDWPWYSWIAPVSWLIQRDVDEAREHLNFSEFDRPQDHADDAAEEVEEGEMPPWFYLPLHPEAKLTDEERADLVAGLRRTFSDGRRSR